MTTDADLEFQDEGTIFVIYSGTEEGEAWLATHVNQDGPKWAGGIVVEHRYAADIFEGAVQEGLTVTVQRFSPPAYGRGVVTDG